jgi:hypothetical protein
MSDKSYNDRRMRPSEKAVSWWSWNELMGRESTNRERNRRYPPRLPENREHHRREEPR